MWRLSQAASAETRHLWAILDEVAPRRPMGGRDVLAVEPERLRDVVRAGFSTLAHADESELLLCIIGNFEDSDYMRPSGTPFSKM